MRRQGERYFADGLRDISGDRRLAILAVCVVEWRAAIADAVVETHDRIVGKTWREAKRLADTRIDDAKTTLPRILRTFTGLGAALLEAQNDGASLEHAVSSGPGWSGLRDLVEAATRLTDTMSVDPLAHVGRGYHRFRRYAPRMLRALQIEAAPVAMPLMAAACCWRGLEQRRPMCAHYCPSPDHVPRKPLIVCGTTTLISVRRRPHQVAFYSKGTFGTRVSEF